MGQVSRGGAEPCFTESRYGCTAVAHQPLKPAFPRRNHQKVPAETHVQQGPIGRDEILQLIRDRLADILEIDPDTVNEGDSFAEDLHADSLAMIELVETLEEELSERSAGFRIDDDELEDMLTVRDAADYIVARL